ncbi:GntR family transcriptional regulator [Alloyangia pacifica]|uniref:GntR family transcriptional regulator n=1 Tax=Alloyangia pacifica TaxID=311180 RepID=UPI001C40B18A|nr:GntR family transcriptional regulator [Alloyangia pacifica]
MTDESTEEPAQSNVERVYDLVRDLAIRFELRPGERVNEVALARQLQVSRTPLREALNRLTADGFLDCRTGKGFFRRNLEVKEIFDLYEFRQKIEIAGSELAAERADPTKVQELRDFLEISRRDDPERTVEDLVALDEQFHEMLAALSGNGEIVETLRRINARIRFVRWVAMENDRRSHTQCEHVAILDAVASGRPAEARQILQHHIDARLEQITEAIRNSYAQIYMNGTRAEAQ